MPSDNVVPFPIPDPADLANRLLATGSSPQDVLNAILSMGRGFEPPQQRQPTLLPRSKRLARYTVRVDLDGSAPRIWRRIEVPSDMMLDRLHLVLQAAMGWTESHLHAFEMGPKRDHRITRFLTAYDLEEGDEGIAEADVRLDEALAEPGDRLFYEYDFGDGWDHTLKLEKVDDPGEEPVRVRVTGGRRACPPEDVGGIGSYNELVTVLGHDVPPADEWMREKIAWLPPGFDPAEFDVEAADLAAADAAAGRWSSITFPFTHPELVELLLALGPFSPLDDLIDRALNESGELSSEAIERATRPLAHLLELVGDDGAELTSAGYLKPALVEQLSQATGVTTWWIGKANREDLTPPIAQLRSAAESLGLVRKRNQRLMLTPAGRRTRRDPTALWTHLVEGLPVGRRREQRQAGLLTLLAVAAGRWSHDIPEAAEAMQRLGWRVSGRSIDEYEVFECARPTWEVLWALDLADYRRTPGAASALARAALRPVD